MAVERKVIYSDELVRIVLVRGEGEIPEHTHENETEIVIPVRGEVTVVIEGREFKQPLQTPLRIEPGTRHSARIKGEGIAIFVKKE